MGVICPLCRAGGGWLPASHLGKSRSGIGCAYKYPCKICTPWLRKYFACSCVSTPSATSSIFSLCPSAMMISVTVELTASEPIAAVNDLSIFSTSGRNVSSQENELSELSGNGKPGLFCCQFEEKIRIHASLCSGFYLNQLSGLLETILVVTWGKFQRLIIFHFMNSLIAILQ